MLRSEHGSPYIPAGTSEASAPWNAPDDTRRAFDCAACRKIGYEEFPGADAYVDELGFPLKGAAITPSNKWACSASCYSQSMYEACESKEKLDAVADALMTLREHLDQPLIAFLNTWLGHRLPTFQLLDAAEKLEDALTQKSEPRWRDRATREEQLERAILAATVALRVQQIRADAMADGDPAVSGDEFLRTYFRGIVNGIGGVLDRLGKAAA